MRDIGEEEQINEREWVRRVVDDDGQERTIVIRGRGHPVEFGPGAVPAPRTYWAYEWAVDGVFLEGAARPQTRDDAYTAAYAYIEENPQGGA